MVTGPTQQLRKRHLAFPRSRRLMCALMTSTLPRDEGSSLGVKLWDVTRDFLFILGGFGTPSVVFHCEISGILWICAYLKKLIVVKRWAPSRVEILKTE